MNSSSFAFMPMPAGERSPVIGEAEPGWFKQIRSIELWPGNPADGIAARHGQAAVASRQIDSEFRLARFKKLKLISLSLLAIAGDTAVVGLPQPVRQHLVGLFRMCNSKAKSLSQQRRNLDRLFD